jgi:hypothetical protein
MNDVTLKADASAKPIEGGLEIAVTGTGRTVEAIQRMVPAHAHEIEQTHLNGWNAKTAPLPNGVLLTVTSSDPQQVQHIRGLGFIGQSSAARIISGTISQWPRASSCIPIDLAARKVRSWPA